MIPAPGSAFREILAYLVEVLFQCYLYIDGVLVLPFKPSYRKGAGPVAQSRGSGRAKLAGRVRVAPALAANGDGLRSIGQQSCYLSDKASQQGLLCSAMLNALT